MYGLWRFAYQVNNGLSVVAFDVGNNAHCHRHLFPVFPVFGDDTFCKIHCRTQVIQIQLLTETTGELIVNRSVCRFFATAWTFWLIYVVDNYFMWPGFLTGAGLFFRRSAHSLISRPRLMCSALNHSLKNLIVVHNSGTFPSTGNTCLYAFTAL